MSEPKFYIIVCDDFHGAAGPYVGLASAIEACKEENKKGECNYRPVPIAFTDRVQTYTMPDTPDDIEWTGGGQYL